MRAVVVTDVDTFSVEEVADPVPRADEVVVKVEASGLCGSDVHLVRGDLAPRSYPFTPGHEVAGVVVDAGNSSADRLVGTPVAVHPFLECGTCAGCASGRPNICVAPGVIGAGGSGGCAEFVAVSTRKIFALGDLPFAAGVLAEPLACVVHALTMSTVPARTALVVGGGVTGAFFVDLLRARGAGNVVVVDLAADKRALMLGRGARAAHASIEEATADAPDGFDLVVDAVGAPGLLEQAVTAVATGGEILQFGIPAERATATIRPALLYHKEFKIIGSRGLSNDYPAALEHLSNGDVDWESLAEPLVPLESFGAALSRVETGQATRVILAP